MAVATIYHNNHCNSSGNAVRIAEELGVDVDIVMYIKSPPDADTLRAIIAKVEDEPTELVRRDSMWKKLGLTDADVTPTDQIVDVLVAHKQLLQRPLVVTADTAIIGRPKERVSELLAPLAGTSTE
jgi:arsenate reductase